VAAGVADADQGGAQLAAGWPSRGWVHRASTRTARAGLLGGAIDALERAMRSRSSLRSPIEALGVDRARPVDAALSGAAEAGGEAEAVDAGGEAGVHAGADVHEVPGEAEGDRAAEGAWRCG
jgi:hypothetical protein